MMWVVLICLYHMCVKCLAMSQTELEDFSNFLHETSRLDQSVKSNSPNDYDDDAPISDDNAWEESGKFEGDLVLNERQRRMIVASVAEGLARNGVSDTTKRWPNNEVIYYIQVEHFSSDQMQSIQNGIDDLARASCVKFTPYKKGDRDAVVIQGSRGGCFSQVGYQGGYQILNLSSRHPAGRGCFRHGTVVHEMLHTLGFYHMQSSHDRDDYIDVLWPNIVKNARHNFRKYNSFSVSNFGVGYDYDSVLHYSRRAFSSNGQDTLVPKQGGAEIGQRIGMSDKDIEKLNKMYCDADSDLPADSDDSIQKISKKNVKNKPFEGHGLGYQKGKTVIIKLPKAEVNQFQDPPQFTVFDYFSKARQRPHQTLIQGIGVGEEIIVNNDEILDKRNMKEYIPFTLPKLPQQIDNKNKGLVIIHNKKNNAEEAVSDIDDIDDDLKAELLRLSHVKEPRTSAQQSQIHDENRGTYNFKDYSTDDAESPQSYKDLFNNYNFPKDTSFFDDHIPRNEKWFNGNTFKQIYRIENSPSFHYR